MKYADSSKTASEALSEHLDYRFGKNPKGLNILEGIRVPYRSEFNKLNSEIDKFLDKPDSVIFMHMPSASENNIRIQIKQDDKILNEIELYGWWPREEKNWHIMISIEDYKNALFIIEQKEEMSKIRLSAYEEWKSKQ